MSIIYLLLPLSLLLAIIALGAYIWALKSGQFDDLDTPSLRVLGDESSVDEFASGKSPIKSDQKIQELPIKNDKI